MMPLGFIIMALCVLYIVVVSIFELEIPFFDTAMLVMMCIGGLIFITGMFAS